MKKQQGFTLIELIVVIVILGILAVIAAPKFINLQKEARISTLEGAKAALQGANAMVYAKSAIEGEQELSRFSGLDPAVVVGDQTVATSYGYLVATTEAVTPMLKLAADEWEVDVVDAVGVVISPADRVAQFDDDTEQEGLVSQCVLLYQEAQYQTQKDEVVPPLYQVYGDGC